jgi:hypothetical protein
VEVSDLPLRSPPDTQPLIQSASIPYPDFCRLKGFEIIFSISGEEAKPAEADNG